MKNCYLCHRLADTDTNVLMFWKELHGTSGWVEIEEWAHRDCLNKAERLLNAECVHIGREGNAEVS